ncbi:hypothetical protein [Pleomorphovibrio marinus]|uniref:hypothetical protein n=1 Tax=Pleomorphovibrio marinus TaxID=2164132 RepID=UPI000E0A9C8E|nr:hypothetical protein [Pleomorphovibrio marinus]
MPIDYSKYPDNWKTEIRPRVLERAGNCCEFCGVKNYSIVYREKTKNGTIWHRNKFDAPTHWRSFPVKVILTIAHLDHDETNHEVKLDRLAALCQLCHLRYDAKEKYRRAKKIKP